MILTREEMAGYEDRGGVWIVCRIPSTRYRTSKSCLYGSMWMSEARRRTASTIIPLTKRMTGAWSAPNSVFAWLDGRGDAPNAAGSLGFRPMMLAHALEPADLETLDPAAFLAEWKWDGVRVQLAGDAHGSARLYSRTGDDIGAAFPELRDAFDRHAVLDGELLIGRAGVAASFSDLQQRLNRKTPTRALLETHPAFIRLYDLLFTGDEDLRTLPFETRRARLEDWFQAHLAAHPHAARFDLSARVAFDGWAQLASLRDDSAQHGAEGLMLKRRDSPYIAGRPRGAWFKWKRDPRAIDAVLMYAQRGHGKRSSFYSDFTFGCWRDDGDLVPVGRAYFGFTDDELTQLDCWVRRIPATGSAPCAKSRRTWSANSPSTACSARRGTNPASPCASRASPGSAGTSPPRRPIGSRRWSG